MEEILQMSALELSKQIRHGSVSVKEAVEWTVAHPSEAGALVQNHTLGLQAPIATKVIPNGAYVFIPAKEAQFQLEELYSIFLEFAPDAIGGELPSDNFYFD